MKNLWAVIQSGRNVSSNYYVVHASLRTREQARKWIKKNTVVGKNPYTKLSIVKFVKS